MAVNPFPNPYPAATPQLAYNFNFGQPLPGTPSSEAGAVEEVVTGVQPAGYSIFGCLVVNDASVSFAEPNIGNGPQAGQGIKHPASSGDVTGGVVGIVMRSAAMETRRDTYPPSYAPNQMVNVLRAGRIWTASEVAVTKHDPVYVRITANGALNTLGALRNDADGGNAVLVPGAKWYDTQATPGAPARAELMVLAQ